MGKPQFRDQAHIGRYYQSEIMDVIQTHTDGITDDVWNDIEGDIYHLVFEMIKDINRIAEEHKDKRIAELEAWVIELQPLIAEESDLSESARKILLNNMDKGVDDGSNA